MANEILQEVVNKKETLLFVSKWSNLLIAADPFLFWLDLYQPSLENSLSQKQALSNELPEK